MADLVFDVPTLPHEREYAKAALRYAQSLARLRRCERPTEFRYRWFNRVPGRRGAHYEVVIDGDFAEIQGFGAELSIAIHHFCQGICAVSPGWRRSLIPDVIRAALFRAIVERSQEFEEITRAVTAFGAPIAVNSYVFARTQKPELDQTLGALTQALIQWRNQRLAPAVVLEQLHTALEVLLKRVLGASNRDFSFAQLVSAASHGSLMTPAEASVMLSLKDIRRDGKHRGQPLSERRLQMVLAPAVGVLQRLAIHLSPSAAALEEQTKATHDAESRG